MDANNAQCQVESEDCSLPLDYVNDDFDYSGFFERAQNRSLSASESEEFCARVMGIFCRDIFAERKPPEWVLQFIANEFSNVLMGKPWVDAFPLPWTQRTPIGTRAEIQSLQIACDIAQMLKDESDAKVTEAIGLVAAERCVSYETARAAWYARRDAFKGFLASDSKS
jgi:hypothetical protein